MKMGTRTVDVSKVAMKTHSDNSRSKRKAIPNPRAKETTIPYFVNRTSSSSLALGFRSGR